MPLKNTMTLLMAAMRREFHSGNQSIASSLISKWGNAGLQGRAFPWKMETYSAAAEEKPTLSKTAMASSPVR